MSYKLWKCSKVNNTDADSLADSLQIPHLLAEVLCARGYSNAREALDFLNGSAPLSDPFLMQDMGKAVDCIQTAVENNEKILIFGDYDVDGITATAIVYTYLKSVGANIKCMLPSRNGDGYGLSKNAINTIHKNGIQLIITVDNGISALQETEYAHELGMKIVVTDHHLPGKMLPAAEAVVDPMREDDTSPAKNLCGAGVAFKLCCALEHVSCEEMLEFSSDLVSLGTIADVMELKGESRTLVRAGLENLMNTEHAGLYALLEKCDLSPEKLFSQNKKITAENVGYIIAPRINAAGRMEHPRKALSLILDDDPDSAQIKADDLIELNASRQAEEKKIYRSVELAIEALQTAEGEQNFLLIWGEGYHPGVIGIAANRITEKYNRPCIIVSIEGNKARGSGRSVEGLDLHEAISSCSDLLQKFGGHKMAVGFSMDLPDGMEHKYDALKELRSRLNRWADQNCSDLNLPVVQADTEVLLSAINSDNVQSLEILEPFGNGNPKPVFLARSVLVEKIYPIKEQHSRICFRQNTARLNATWFRKVPEELNAYLDKTADVLFTAEIYNGNVSAKIVDMRPAGQQNSVTEELAACDMLCRNTLYMPENIDKFKVDRATVAEVYRYIRNHPNCGEDLRLFCQSFQQVNSGKIAVSLQALVQLGLIEKTKTQNCVLYHMPAIVVKKNLADAPIIQKLGGLC